MGKHNDKRDTFSFLIVNIPLIDHALQPVLVCGNDIWGMFSVDTLNKLKDLYFSKKSLKIPKGF